MDFMARVLGTDHTKQIHSSHGSAEDVERNVILRINLLLTIFCETLYTVTHLRASNIFSMLLRNFYLPAFLCRYYKWVVVNLRQASRPQTAVVFHSLSTSCNQRTVVFLRDALYRDSAALAWLSTKNVSMPSTMSSVAAGIAWKCNNDMVNNRSQWSIFLLCHPCNWRRLLLAFCFMWTLFYRIF